MSIIDSIITLREKTDVSIVWKSSYITHKYVFLNLTYPKICVCHSFLRLSCCQDKMGKVERAKIKFNQRHCGYLLF